MYKQKIRAMHILVLEFSLYIHCLCRPHGPVWRRVITTFLWRCSQGKLIEIYRIHRLIIGYKRKHRQIIACATYGLVNSNYCDVFLFPLSFVLGLLVFYHSLHFSDFYDGVLFCVVSWRRFLGCFKDMFLP